jgi:hypothetical protein
MGLICPCLESTEERMARESFLFLQTKHGRKAWRVQWHRSLPLLNGLTSGGSSDHIGSGNDKPSGGFFKNLVSSVVTSTMGYNTCNATLKIMENQYGVTLKITKTDNDGANKRAGLSSLDDDMEDDESQMTDESESEEHHPNNKKKSKRTERVILLRNIGGVEPAASHTNGIVLFGIADESSAKSSSSSATAVGSSDSKGKELLRLDLLTQQQGSSSATTTDHEMESLRNDMVDHLGVVCRWDRLRHAAYVAKEKAAQAANVSGNSNHSTAVSSQTLDYDEDGAPLPQRNRAQRAAHFAKREMELTKVKSDRESRKAKYMAQSGGLKYTAVAMAQRAMDQED